ncbi:MAG: nitroreductase [Chitinophagaceae bacterium]
MTTPFNTEEINKLIRTRRSVFAQQFEPGKTVPDEIIMEALENANWAPTHKLSEPWRFTVFTGAGLQTLAEKQAAIYKEFAGPKFKQPKYESMLATPLQCSHIIAIGCHPDPTLPVMEEIAAVACAVQNIYLTVSAYGVGGYWSTGGITFMEEAKPLFNLGTEDLLMGFFYLGYVRVPSPAGKRKPVTDKTQWVRG